MEAPPSDPVPVVMIAADSSAHRAILELTTRKAENELGVPVELRVDALKQAGELAFLLAGLRAPGGGSLDLSRTSYAEHAAAGSLSDAYAVLLRGDGSEWTIVTYVLGPGDVAWEDWDRRYNAPTALFR